MKGEASHLKIFRRAGLEPLALSASGRETMVYGLAAASEEKRIDFSVGIARFGDIRNRDGPLLEIGPRSMPRTRVFGRSTA